MHLSIRGTMKLRLLRDIVDGQGLLESNTNDRLSKRGLGRDVIAPYLSKDSIESHLLLHPQVAFSLRLMLLRIFSCPYGAFRLGADGMKPLNVLFGDWRTGRPSGMTVGNQTSATSSYPTHFDIPLGTARAWSRCSHFAIYL
jgi:hypothetical protein